MRVTHRPRPSVATSAGATRRRSSPELRRAAAIRLRPGPAVRATVASAALLIGTAVPAAAQHAAPAVTPDQSLYSLQPVSPSQAADWRADLRALVGDLTRVHPDPFHATSKARFDAAVAALADSIPGLPAHRIVMGFARLLALVGNGHTSLPLYFARGVDFHALPYRLGVHDDGIYVEAADHAYASLVGGRLVAIGGVPAQEALRRVTPLISRDNDNWISVVAPNLLNRIEVLQGLGMAKDLRGADLTVRIDSALHTVHVRALTAPQSHDFGLPFRPRLTDNWVDARDSSGAPVPLYQRRYKDLYWWTYLPDQDLLYVQFDVVQNRRDGPTALQTFRQAMAFARDRRPARTVIDIRNNTGGEGGLLPPIIREIVRTREVDQPGKLFLVIGPRTFSAGQMMVGWMRMFTTAVLVGRPTSSRFEGYAGHAFLRLPRSGIAYFVSPAYYEMGRAPGDPRPQATPRLAAVSTFADYVTNRDPAMDAIRAYDPGALSRQVLAALHASDTTRAAARVRAYDADPVNRYHDGTAALNELGYRLLGEDGEEEDALAVFELNTRVHPGYANGWDSLGEAYVREGRRRDAIEAFRRALALNPNLASSKAWLHRLGAASSGGETPPRG